MISLGRDLIASMNGQNFNVKRSLSGGEYVNGVYVERIPNQAYPIRFTDQAATIQARLRKITGMSTCTVTNFGPLGFRVNFGSVGARSLLQVVANTLGVAVVIARFQTGDSLTVEIQSITYDIEPITGSLTLSLGSPTPAPTAVIFASLQPLTAREVVRLPEGDRSRQRYKLYSADLLQPSNEKTDAKGDIVTVEGEEFEVESIEPWTNFWKAVIVKIERIEAS